jgi:hypothetical protein
MELQWVVMTPTEQDFEFWIKHKYNVLFIGSHGIGKTSMITKAWTKYGLNHRYFSASTMDPWVDFIGVPKEQIDEHGMYLDLVKPKDFRDDTVQALFFDEYNRAPSKVQNAVMELIQFKSINGRKFENLNIVWAAINESEGDIEYNVDKLDYAQLDRFHIIVKLPSKPNLAYFKSLYDKNGVIGCKWWDQLPDNLKAFISPRRLEVVLDLHSKGGNIEYALPSNANVKTLISNLKNGLPWDILCRLILEGDFVKLKEWLTNEESLSQVLKGIIKNDDYLKICLPLLPQEKQTELISKNEIVKTYVKSNPSEYESIIVGLRKSKNKDLAVWATGVKIAKDAKPLSTGSVSGAVASKLDSINMSKDDGVSSSASGIDWLVSPTRGTLTREYALLKGVAWDAVKISKFSHKTIVHDCANPEINVALKRMTPTGGAHTTPERIKNINTLMFLLAKTNACQKAQLLDVVGAINYWSTGMQLTTLEKIATSTPKTKAIITDLLAQFIENESVGVSPYLFFNQYQYMGVWYKDVLKLKWTI